jgi:hypothetical protein
MVLTGKSRRTGSQLITISRKTALHIALAVLVHTLQNRATI